MPGVSPAYFISLFSEKFSLRQLHDALPGIRDMGYSHVQLETFSRDHLLKWDSEVTTSMNSMIEKSGLKVSQFVAHHLLKYFREYRQFSHPDLFTEFKKVAAIVSQIHGCRIITIPQPAFEISEPITSPLFRTARTDYLETLSRLLEISNSHSLTLALEIMPGSFVGNSDGFLRILENLDAPDLGYNFDTGHAWAAGERVELIPFKLAERIVGTHLSDNFGLENLSLAPGKGLIPWKQLLRALRIAGYKGSYDIEIRCAGEIVHEEYSFALQVLNTLLQEVLEVEHAETVGES